MSSQQPKYEPGQVIHHLNFDYTGVIVGVDAEFSGSEEWYDKEAHTRPPKDGPWYHVLVHDGEQKAYVAERNLHLAANPGPINNPSIPLFFDTFRSGRYIRRRLIN